MKTILKRILMAIVLSITLVSCTDLEWEDDLNQNTIENTQARTGEENQGGDGDGKDD